MDSGCPWVTESADKRGLLYSFNNYLLSTFEQGGVPTSRGPESTGADRKRVLIRTL